MEENTSQRALRWALDVQVDMLHDDDERDRVKIMTDSDGIH